VDSIPEKSGREIEEEKWLVCPVCKQPNPVGTRHCQHCWGASLFLVHPVTTEELAIIMERERLRSRRRNLIKIVSVSIIAPVLLSLAVFFSIYGFTDLILAPPHTLNSNPSDGEWTMFRHDLNHSGSTNLDSTQSQGNLKWSFFPLEEELTKVQTAMDTMMAEKDLDSVLATSKTTNMLSFPARNPLYPDYLDVSTTRGLYSCDSEGSVRLESGIHSSPTVVDGIIYFGSQDRYLYAVDADTGTKLWEFGTNGFVESSPAVVDGVVYFGSNDSNFYALDAKTGDPLWNFSANRSNQSSPAVAEGMVFFGSDDSHIYALDAKTGEKVWEYETDNHVISSPAIDKGILYICSLDNFMYALQANNGRFRLQVLVNATTSSPAVKDDIVYFNSSGNLFAIDGQARNWPGEYHFRHWWVQLSAYYLAPEPPPASGYLWNIKPRWYSRNSASSPVISNNTIYTAFDKYLYAIDVETHEQLWELPFVAGDNLRSSPSLGDDVLYIGSEDGCLYAVNATNGEELWHFTTGGSITSSPALVNGVIYVTSHDGKLYAIE